MTGLAGKGIAAAKWSAVLTVARFMLQLVAQVFLARLLGPDNYGIFGMGLIVFLLSTFLTEFGFGMYLLQRPTVRDEDIRFVFSWQILIGAIASLVIFLSAPWVAAYFQDARVVPVLQWMSLGALLNAAGALATVLLYRDLNFRAIGLIELGSYFLGFLCVGTTLALYGFGVTTLVAAWLTQALTKLVALKLIRPHVWRPLFRHPDSALIFSTGRKVFSTQLLTWVLSNLDRVIIGRLLSAHAVGVYNIGFNLASTAGSLFLNALAPAFLSSGARVDQDTARLGPVYLQVLASIWIFITPAFVMLAFLSNDIVLILYGDEWGAAGLVLCALFATAPALLTLGLSTPILWNTGRGQDETWLQIPIVLLAVPALILAARHGIATVAWTVGGISVLRAFVVSTAACRLVGLTLRQVLPQLLRGAGLCVLVVVAAIASESLASMAGSRLASISLTCVLPVVLVVALSILRPAVLGDAATAMALRIMPRLARWLPVRETAG